MTWVTHAGWFWWSPTLLSVADRDPTFEPSLRQRTLVLLALYSVSSWLGRRESGEYTEVSPVETGEGRVETVHVQSPETGCPSQVPFLPVLLHSYSRVYDRDPPQNPW